MFCASPICHLFPQTARTQHNTANTQYNQSATALYSHRTDTKQDLDRSKLKYAAGSRMDSCLNCNRERCRCNVNINHIESNSIQIDRETLQKELECAEEKEAELLEQLYAHRVYIDHLRDHLHQANTYTNDSEIRELNEVEAIKHIGEGPSMWRPDAGQIDGSALPPLHDIGDIYPSELNIADDTVREEISYSFPNTRARHDSEYEVSNKVSADPWTILCSELQEVVGNSPFLTNPVTEEDLARSTADPSHWMRFDGS